MLDAMPSSAAVLIVEGSEDRRLLVPTLPLGRIIPATGKEPLLGAYRLLSPAEHARIAFIVDCDFDVPAGKLRGSPNLIITTHPAAETDVLDLGGLTGVVNEV